MRRGIANSTLVEQVRNTAAWLWQQPHNAALTAILDAAADEPDGPDALIRTFRVRLGAHYATVATFVPTDVDAQIRHHTWMAVADPESFAQGRECIDEAAARDAYAVSERVTEGLSGHDGEWLSVRAGALGRALVLGLDGEASGLAQAIDAELGREQKAFAAALEGGSPARTTLALATTIAHNLGDLSRVVDSWPQVLRGSELHVRYSRLGHVDGTHRQDLFLLAGELNKALMAAENHRFLALRKPRALRRSRALLLPIGPWFDAWGETIGCGELLDDGDRAEVVAALIELHLRAPAQEGCLRALAGLHRTTRGGLSAYCAALPARLRKEVGRGRLREAIDVSGERFEADFERRFRNVLARLAPRSPRVRARPVPRAAAAPLDCATEPVDTRENSQATR